MSLVGEDGEKLPKRPLTPVDKEFPLAAGRLADKAVYATGGGFHAVMVGQRAGEVS